MRYIAICGLSGPTTCFTLPHKRHDFRGEKKSYRKQKVYFHFLYNVAHSTKNGATHDQKYVLLFMQSARISCQILMKRELSL